jgi:hypothetical protein
MMLYFCFCFCCRKRLKYPTARQNTTLPQFESLRLRWYQSDGETRSRWKLVHTQTQKSRTLKSRELRVVKKELFGCAADVFGRTQKVFPIFQSFE